MLASVRSLTLMGTIVILVGFLNNYSKHICETRQGEQLLADLKAQQGGIRPPASPAPKKAHRLSDAQIAALIDGYKTGVTTYALADTFSTTRDTVRKHLKSSNTKMRRRGLSAGQAKAAAALYIGGASSNAIAEKFEVSPTTVLRKLRDLNIEIR